MSDMESLDFVKKVLRHVWAEFVDHFDAAAIVDRLYSRKLIDDSTMDVILTAKHIKDANRVFLLHLRSNATIESLEKLCKLLHNTGRDHHRHDRLATLLEDELKQWKGSPSSRVAAQRGDKGESPPSFRNELGVETPSLPPLHGGSPSPVVGSETTASSISSTYSGYPSQAYHLQKTRASWPKLLGQDDDDVGEGKSVGGAPPTGLSWSGIVRSTPEKQKLDRRRKEGAEKPHQAISADLGVSKLPVVSKVKHDPLSQDDDSDEENQPEGMSHATREMNVKTVIQSLRSYLTETLPIDTGLLTALQGEGLFGADTIKPWKSLLFQGKESIVRNELVDYIGDFYTPEFLTRFTKLLRKHSKPILKDIAEKLRVEMGKAFKNKSEDEGRSEPDDNVDKEFRKVIHDVLKNNSVRVQVAKCILLGPPEVGKTQLKRALLGNFEKVLESTNCSTQATPAVEVYIDGGKEWKTFSEHHLKSFTSMESEKKSYLPTSTDFSATKENLISNPSQPLVSTSDLYESAPSQSTRSSDSSRTRAEFRRLSQTKARQIEEAKPECSDSLKFKLMYIIDNGGQPSFLDFHSVTATFPASYFLVYDARKGLDARPEMTFRKSDFRIKEMPPSNYSNYDLLRRSLLTVHHFTHRFTKRIKLIENLLPDFKAPPAPSTLIIGTNKDTTHQKCENIDEPRLKRLYQNIPSLKYQVSVYCVDSMKPECKALKDIRSSVSQEDNLCQFPLPLSWFQLYLLSLSVGSDESLQVHKYCDLCDMCLQEKHVKSEREFRAMVIVMDCLGVFSCPDVEVLTSSAPDADISGNILVFIDPNLLFEYVSRILIIPFLDLSQSPVCLRKLQVCGELTKECLAKLNIPDTLSTLPGFHEKLLEWLVKWGLAAKKDGIDQWFIPSVLPPRPKTVSPLISNGYFCEVFPFYLTFTQETGENYTFHYLPAGFFPLFVVHLMQSKHFSLFKSNSRCRDSLLLLKESDSKYTFNVHLVDEADRLAVYMSPANQGLCSDASTLKHAGAILADLRDCMTDTNNQLFSTNTDCITLCSACRCGKSTQNQCHLAQIKENQDKSWSSRCLHTDRLQSGCYEKSIESDSDIDSDMAQILNGFASGLASRHDRSQSPCQPQSLRHSPRSPRQGLRSSKQRSRSPRQGSRSLRQGLRSSKQRSRSPRQGSRSPKQRSRSPRQGSRSSKQRSRSPRQGSQSSKQQSRSSRHRSRSLKYRSQSPSHRSRSPKCKSRYTGRKFQSSKRRSSSSTCRSSSAFSDQSQSPTHESNLPSSTCYNQTKANRQETASGSGMSHATREMNVKTVIQSLRSYLTETLPIDADLLTALHGEKLIAADNIKPWKSLLSQGKENEVCCKLVDYIEGFYTPEFLTRFTDLLLKQSKKCKPILKDIAEKLRVEMGKGLSS